MYDGVECVQGPDGGVESDFTGFSVPLEHSFEVGEFRFGFRSQSDRD